MTRAAFVSNCGDPFLVLLLHKLFKNRWYDEIDTMYINVNNHCGVPQEVISELLAKLSLDSKVQIIYHPRGIGNGLPITEMTLLSKEELVVLLEDDSFIFEKGVVNECFQKIESDLADAVGSPRGSCGQEIWDASKAKYGLDYSGYGDQGPNFWPNFFFARRKDLLRTDLNFASKTFNEGDYCKELGHTFKAINHGDTFVWACIQLRALGLRFHNFPQHHAGPFEIQDKEKGEQNWHPSQQPFKWIHGGSLSASWGGYLSGQIPDVSNDSAMQEMESRCAFWIIAQSVVKGFDNFRFQYQQGINNLIENAKLDKERIGKKIKIYRELMKI